MKQILTVTRGLAVAKLSLKGQTLRHRRVIEAGVGVAICALVLGAASRLSTAQTVPQQPEVLVELFTSEGCSSCPPADELLEQLDRQNSRSAIKTVVLSEHVDYWNHGGWRDPYSSALYSQRQGKYSERFGIDDVYTPQMIVDGATQFAGNDPRAARNAIEQAGRQSKADVRVTPLDQGSTLRVRVEVNGLPKPMGNAPAEVYLAVAQNQANSQVSAGENSGRHLHHVAVVKNLRLLGKVNPDGSFRQEVPLDLRAGADTSQLRLVAFVQEHDQGRVLGAAMAMASSQSGS